MDGKSERELIAWCISQLRRNIVGDFAYGMMRTFGEDDYSFPQLATLLYPDVEGEQTIKGVAEMLGRSLSATSRLLDQLVVRGTISRREDERDRRVKRVSITKHGRALVASVKQRRADVQIAVMNYLSPEERAQAIRGMTLLVEATKRRQKHHGHHESPAKRATRP